MLDETQGIGSVNQTKEEKPKLTKKNLRKFGLEKTAMVWVLSPYIEHGVIKSYEQKMVSEEVAIKELSKPIKQRNSAWRHVIWPDENVNNITVIHSENK